MPFFHSSLIGYAVTKHDNMLLFAVEVGMREVDGRMGDSTTTIKVPTTHFYASELLPCNIEQ